MAKKIKGWWSLFYYGSSLTICSEHRTAAAAEREARRCERRGGARHLIVYVEQVDRADEVSLRGDDDE